MRFLVTGASGMIGSSLVEMLVARHGKDSVLALTSPHPNTQEQKNKRMLDSLDVAQWPMDLLDRNRLIHKLPEVDQVFHLAANLRTDLREHRRNAPMRVNDLGTLNLIKALGLRLRGKLFVYGSSIGAVDRDAPQGERLDEESPCYPRTLYGRTKLRGERIVMRMADRMGFRYSIFRLATVYGPRCREEHIFNRFTKWVEGDSILARINWPGRISLIHVDDVVDILMRTIVSRKMEGNTFFVSNSEIVTVGAWVKIMSEALGKQRKFHELPPWFVALMNRIIFQYWFWRWMPRSVALAAWRLSLILSDGFYCDSTKLNRAYPKPYINAREGVRRTYGFREFAALAEST